MSQEIRLAFAHPSERSKASDGGTPLDRISLRDHIVEVEIGAFQQERGTTQRVCFNVVVEVALAPELEDDVDRILSYDRVTEAIAHELAAERLNLLETLAERIAERILAEPQAMRAFVRIEKLDRGPGALGVEIVRSKQQLRDRVDGGGSDTPDPRVVFVRNDVIHSDRLGAQIDALEQAGVPVIFCVDLPAGSRPLSVQPLAQRRIDLLALEQNAWVLAGRDARCVVVASRTEIDWAMKHGQICVWAPSKIVLDAVDGPASCVVDAHALAVWFARMLGGSGASELADATI